MAQGGSFAHFKKEAVVFVLIIEEFSFEKCTKTLLKM